VVLLRTILAAPNVLLSSGGPIGLTSRDAIAGAPAPPFVDVTVAVLAFSPTVVPVTLTVNVQVTPAVMGASAYEKEPEPADTPVIPATQGPVPENPSGFAITRPAGSVSLITTPVSATAALGFVTERVRLVLVLCTMLAAPNVLVSTGGVCADAESRAITNAVQATRTLRYFAFTSIPDRTTTFELLACSES